MAFVVNDRTNSAAAFWPRNSRLLSHRRMRALESCRSTVRINATCRTKIARCKLTLSDLVRRDWTGLFSRTFVGSFGCSGVVVSHLFINEPGWFLHCRYEKKTLRLDLSRQFVCWTENLLLGFGVHYWRRLLGSPFPRISRSVWSGLRGTRSLRAGCSAKWVDIDVFTAQNEWNEYIIQCNT